ncbi:MAG: EAL domain-containing protein [Candidatus Enteromonas sp.]|nr:EAL domain-containing protein [Candidatus Enteromonas sp.]
MKHLASLESKRKGNRIAIGSLLSLAFLAFVATLILAIVSHSVYLYVELGLFSLSLVCVALALALLFVSGAISKKIRWAQTLFGTELVAILDEDEFILKANARVRSLQATNKRLPQIKQKSPYVISFSVRSIRSIETGSSSSALHAINLAVSEILRANYGQSDVLFAASERGTFLLYAEAEAERYYELKDAFVHFASELTDSFESRGDLPPISVLLGASEVLYPREEIADAIAHSEYALRFNASGRLSGDLLLFDRSLVKEEEERKTLEEEITRALENEEFQIYYQAKWDIKAGRFYGAEALIRWKHPTRGIIPPSSFIPYCESSQKIVEIDHYVFEHVCADIAKWNAETKRRLVVSVNLSRRSIYDPSLLTFLEETLAKNRLLPNQIDIELTESLAAQNIVYISAIIRRIRAIGFLTSMDDFGVGYSSLSSLKNIPFNTLKIDKSFIDDIEIDPRSASMVQSIINLVHALDMKVIAEGVEAHKQVEILSSLGLDAIQGYYYSRPLERSRFESFLASNIFEGKGDKKGGRP